ncbi:MAG: ATP-binding cassette domain-containing protein, partial [Ilumatobacteraceae bacterium]
MSEVDPAPTSEVLLRFEGVHAYYGKATILDDVSFAVAEGETLALIGRNGAGKPTARASIFG